MRANYSVYKCMYLCTACKQLDILRAWPCKHYDVHMFIHVHMCTYMHGVGAVRCSRYLPAKVFLENIGTVLCVADVHLHCICIWRGYMRARALLLQSQHCRVDKHFCTCMCMWNIHVPIQYCRCVVRKYTRTGVPTETGMPTDSGRRPGGA